MAPAAPRLIGRGDLVAALDRSATRKVTVIPDPAGSGRRRRCAPWPAAGQPRRLAVLVVQRGQQDTQQLRLALLARSRALALAEPDRLILLFAMTGSAGLLAAVGPDALARQ